MLNQSSKAALVIALSAFTYFSSANAEPDNLVQLNTNTNTERFRIDPNNGYVVFNEFDSAGQLQRYTTQIDGQLPPIQIGTNINETRSGSNFGIASNNSRIINRLDNPLTGDRDFLSVSINGDNSTLLRPAAPIRGDVSSTSFSSADNILVFDIIGGGIFSIPNDGSAPAINLSDTIDSTGNVDVGTRRRTLDGSIVVFDAEIDTIGQQALFSVPIDGSSSPTRLTSLNDSVIDSFVITADQSSVVYLELNGPSFDILEQQLFIVPMDGSSAPIALTNLFDDFGLSFINFTISPDGTQVVYTLPNFTSGITQLFRVATDGQSAPVLIDEGLEVHQFEITTDSQHIIYSLTQIFDSTFSNASIPVIYRASLNSTPNDIPVILSLVNPNPFDVTTAVPLEQPINTDVGFVVSQDSNFVFFIQDLNIPFSDNNLRRASIKNPTNTPIIINQPNFPPTFSFTVPFFTTVLDFKLSNDETFIVYNFNTSLSPPSPQDLIPTQLSKVAIDGSNNQLLPASNLDNVLDFDISNNDEYVVFTSGFVDPNDPDNPDNLINLFSLNLTLEQEEQPFCFPIKAQNDNFVTICL